MRQAVKRAYALAPLVLLFTRVTYADEPALAQSPAIPPTPSSSPVSEPRREPSREPADGPPISSVDFAEEVPPSRPQFSGGLLLGGSVTDLRPPDLHLKVHGGFVLGGRFDVVLLRNKERSAGIGPYVDLLTQRFSTFEAGGGLSFLLPAAASMPLVLSAGGLARTSARGLESALVANVFFGSRGYNFHASYGMANGLFLEGRYGLAGSAQLDIVAGVRLDLALFALPVLYLVGSARR